MTEDTGRISREKVAIASDHAGFALKEDLKTLFAGRVEWLDFGTASADSVDYPDYGAALGAAIARGDVARGVVICGTGIGISIAANRFLQVRAAVCTDATMTRLARSHNDANVLALGARIVGPEVARDCLSVFLDTPFEGGQRHERRVEKLGIKH